jgi:hypothetical protein
VCCNKKIWQPWLRLAQLSKLKTKRGKNLGQSTFWLFGVQSSDHNESRGQFFKTSVGANSRVGTRKAKSNTGVGANFSCRRKNPFKKLPSGAIPTIVSLNASAVKKLQRHD